MLVRCGQLNIPWVRVPLQGGRERWIPVAVSPAEQQQRRAADSPAGPGRHLLYSECTRGLRRSGTQPSLVSNQHTMFIELMCTMGEMNKHGYDLRVKSFDFLIE